MNTVRQNDGDHLITGANLVTRLASTEGKSHLEDREMETGGQIRSNLVFIGHISSFINAIFVFLEFKCKH